MALICFAHGFDYIKIDTWSRISVGLSWRVMIGKCFQNSFVNNCSVNFIGSNISRLRNNFVQQCQSMSLTENNCRQIIRPKKKEVINWEGGCIRGRPCWDAAGLRAVASLPPPWDGRSTLRLARRVYWPHSSNFQFPRKFGNYNRNFRPSKFLNFRPNFQRLVLGWLAGWLAGR